MENLTESCLAEESIITDYKYEQNIYSDQQKIILAEFEFNEDGSRVIKCANGIEPKSNSYNQKTENARQ